MHTEIKTVNIDSIKIPRNRIRRELGDISPLAKAMRVTGWMAPIVVDEDLNLVAGERRLISAKKNGEKQVTVQVVPKEMARIIQAIENTHRKELRWDEWVEAVAQVHWAMQNFYERFMKNHGRERRNTRGRPPKPWTQEETAKLFGITQGEVSKILAVRCHKLWPQLRKLDSFKEALAKVMEKASEEYKKEMLARKTAEKESEKLVSKTLEAVKKEESPELKALQRLERQLSLVKALYQVALRMREDHFTCPIHEEEIDLMSVKLPCGHTVADLMEALEKSVKKMEEKVSGVAP